MNVTLRQLRVFIEVARLQSFSRAGDEIGLTQSAVSAQMQRLEEELGFALFDRTGRSATLNDAGRETLALAEEMMTLYARLSERGAGAAIKPNETLIFVIDLVSTNKPGAGRSFGLR